MFIKKIYVYYFRNIVFSINFRFLDGFYVVKFFRCEFVNVLDREGVFVFIIYYCGRYGSYVYESKREVFCFFIVECWY